MNEEFGVQDLICPYCGSGQCEYCGEVYDDEGDHIGSGYDCLECQRSFTEDE